MALDYNKTKINIAIIGLGYVGLPLAIEFSKKYKVIGFDKNEERINQLKQNVDKTLEVDKKVLEVANLSYTTNLSDIEGCNVYIVTVPTPIDNYNNPDMQPLKLASESIGKIININDIIIYESTVYPGATEEFCVPILEEKSKLKYNKDFFCGYSPERINPGDNTHTLTKIIKVVSGSNKMAGNFVNDLYGSIIKAGTHLVSSIAIAEAAKVIENIQRDVNIALINELSIIFDKLNLSTVEILEASKTKWNFLPFKPGLVGGHCIGVDPYYLTHKSIQLGYNPEIILAGRRINENMGKFIADSSIALMKQNNINPKKAKIGIFGFTFKENCPDIRNTKVPNIINTLKNYGCKVVVTDPLAEKKQARAFYGIDLIDISEVKSIDVAFIAVSHDEYIKMDLKQWKKLFKDGKNIIIDVKSIFPKDNFKNSNIVHWQL